jgi:hypothetical protein
VPVVGLLPLGAGKFVVSLPYGTLEYPLPETSLNDGVVLSQYGETVDATSCHVTPPSVIEPPADTVDHAGSVDPELPELVATIILFVPVPETVNVSKFVGMMNAPLPYPLLAVQIFVVCSPK